MRFLRRRLLLLPVLAVATGCGSEGIQLAKDDPMYKAAETFDLRCSGCHTLTASGAQGSAADVNDREYKDGPNFNQRAETYEQVLYAIRNGGYSSGPMPQNIVTGKDAEAVARYVAKYSGGAQPRRRDPGNADPAGSSGG
jgi:mono/diheme cytochrome c family protein